MLAPSSRLREYEVWGRIGGGGMSDVYLARHVDLSAPVVVKTLKTTIDSEVQERVSRLRNEAIITARIRSPRIVRPLDVGVTDDGTPYLVQDYVDGVDLSELDASRRKGVGHGLPLWYVCEVVAEIAAGLMAAHRTGVLHRDLKPSNIMLGDFGEVYVLDWGIARLLTERDTAAAPTTATSMEDLPRGTATADGAWVGTPGYMAPEQVQGESALLDARTDVYALGAVLFEILTGARLHDRGSAALDMASTLDGADASIVDRFPDLEVAPELESICVRATALAKTDRFESVGKLAEALERYLEAFSVPNEPG